MAKRVFSAYIQKQDGYYVAKCPEVETVGWGYSVEEAIENLKMTIEWFFSSYSHYRAQRAELKKIQA